MDSFKEWIDQRDFVEFVQNVFENDAIVSSQSAINHDPQKPWSGKKKEVLQFWKNLKPELPIIMQPVSGNKLSDGGTSSYGEDGVRITGSWQFIASVLSQLKAIIGYENSQTKLRLVFRGVDPERSPNKQSYVFYANLEPRKSKKTSPF